MLRTFVKSFRANYKNIDMNSKLSFLALILLLLSSCGGGQDVKNYTQKVKCEEVKSVGQIVESVSYPGKIVAAADVNLSFRVAGVIDRIVVNSGDYVRDGQIIAYMDERDYKIQLEATQAKWDAINGEVERISVLYAEKSVSQNDYEKAVSGLRQISSQLAAHKNAYEDTQLKAPFDGYIQSVNFHRGEAVAAGTPIVKFVSSAAPEIIVNLPSSEYLRHQELLSANATLTSFAGKTFNLERIGISHKANLNQLYEAKFRVVASDGIYPTLGVSTMVQLNYSGEDNMAVSLLFGAIVQRDGECCVWKIKDGVVQLQRVVVDKIHNDGSAIIKNGVSAGDIVVTAGVNTLTPGQRVEPLQSASKSNVGNIL